MNILKNIGLAGFFAVLITFIGKLIVTLSLWSVDLIFYSNLFDPLRDYPLLAYIIIFPVFIGIFLPSLGFAPIMLFPYASFIVIFFISLILCRNLKIKNRKIIITGFILAITYPILIFMSGGSYVINNPMTSSPGPLSPYSDNRINNLIISSLQFMSLEINKDNMNISRSYFTNDVNYCLLIKNNDKKKLCLRQFKDKKKMYTDTHCEGPSSISKETNLDKVINCYADMYRN